MRHRDLLDVPQSSPDLIREASEVVVSVIITFFNAGRFLEEAIDSVLVQTYKNWELLLVDDGSLDHSSALAKRCASQNQRRIRYLEHPSHANLGISASRNLGIRHASGRYIAFLDADDVWMPTKLDQQVAILDAHPNVDLVYGAMVYWHSWSASPDQVQRDQVPDLGMPLEKVIPPPLLVTRMLCRDAAAPAMSSALIRRTAAVRVGLFEESFRGMHEDQAFVSKLCLHSPVFVSGMCWHRYRQHPDSCLAVSTASGRRRAERLRFLQWLQRYLAQQGQSKGEVWSTVQRQLRPYRFTARLRSRGRRAVKGAGQATADFARRLVPGPVRSWVQRWSAASEWKTAPGARIRFGSLRRLTPISRKWGKDRGGSPIDRFYIDRFLGAQASDIRGQVLEVQDAAYTRRFGGNRVTRSDVLHSVPGNRQATIVADLVSAPAIPSDTFHCVILTQVLLCIEDLGAALRTIHRILRPGGVVLATVPGISQVVRHDMDRWGDYWRFTTVSARRLFESVFPPELVQVESHGNVLAAVAFLHGLASHELRAGELDYRDPDYQVLITIRALKPGTELQEAPGTQA